MTRLPAALRLLRLTLGTTAVLLASGCGGGSEEHCMDLAVEAPAGVQGIAYMKVQNADASSKTGGGFEVPTQLGTRTCSWGLLTESDAHYTAIAWMAPGSEPRPECQDVLSDACQPRPGDLRGEMQFALEGRVTLVHVKVAPVSTP
ncbi:hypothetical protein FGE12_22370 [Aggregicoccus sp. 17bor-14]|uniref:hypothetical protein n=1 Tax=Myxococcaceae TaxID=31 RepID=UPI00129C1BB6|nr:MULTISPECIES: hypothetical protein [Myxococcaceae]MBF5045166.1 hypothetical protein [Simulacricoccus sp. 17bor-14]MRI90907.1 hypothetical protein [Aggregicoccus sp. 17bor-14]